MTKSKSADNGDESKPEIKISFGGQDCHYLNNGAFTGSISASMLKSIGCKYVIIGHSERRQYQNELSKELNLKIKSALASNLKVIYCIGEKFSCLLYTSPSPRDKRQSRMPSSA